MKTLIVISSMAVAVAGAALTASAIEPVVNGSTYTFNVESGAETYSSGISGSGVTLVKTGAGRLLIGNGSDLSGGLVVREGSVGRTAGATVAADMPAKDPILHLDAAKANTYYAWPHDGTNFVAAWQSLDGKSGTYTQETSYKRIPFLNTWDTLNGLPVIDFGKQVNEWSNSDGAYFRVAPEVRNLRAAYVVYGSQAKGGQIFGAKSGTTYDMSRSISPTLDTALFSNPCDDFQSGEVYTNGVKIAAGQNNKFKPTGGYQLIEVHPISGLRFNFTNNAQILCRECLVAFKPADRIRAFPPTLLENDPKLICVLQHGMVDVTFLDPLGIHPESANRAETRGRVRLDGDELGCTFYPDV